MSSTRVTRHLGRDAASATSPPPSRSQQQFAQHHARRETISSITSPTFPSAANLSTHLTPRPSTSPSSVYSRTSPYAQPVGSYFDLDFGKLSIEPRTPPIKRSPASRSSHGIETSSGPPPALITQRSYPIVTNWSPAQSIALPEQAPQPKRPAADDDAGVGSSSQTAIPLDPVKSPEQRAADQQRLAEIVFAIPGAEASAVVEINMNALNASQFNQVSQDHNRDRTLRALEGKGDVDDRASESKTWTAERGGDVSHSSQEDLFLNLARDDTVSHDVGDALNRVERRRPRNTASSQHPRSSRVIEGESINTPSSQHLSTRDRTYAASAHPLDQRSKHRYSGLTAKASFTDQRTGSGSIYDRSDPNSQMYGSQSSFPSVKSRPHPRYERHSNLTPATNGHYSSPLAGRSDQKVRQESEPSTPRAEGTDSTLSTTAPSTVWDELDDLKSRIRKLEVTGTIPASSGATTSNGYGDRPRTATTTVTTASLSPALDPNKGIASQTYSADEGSLASVHPLLHSALAKTKTSISPNIYKALEATATDALTLALMTSSGGGQNHSSNSTSTIGGVSVIDRQLRRKADNMCRSLTELCIALSEEESEKDANGAGSRPNSNNSVSARQQREDSIEDSRLQRASSLDPEFRPASRIMNRLESRRSSILGLHANYSPKERPQDVPTPNHVSRPVASRQGSSSTVLLRRRTNNDEEYNPARPVSRAMTEVRPSPRERTSREYTSQHPLPSQPKRSPSVQSSQPARRSYFLTQSPSTPTIEPGNRRYLDRSTPPSTDSARLAAARQRRIASLGQPTAIDQQRASALAQRLRPDKLVS